MAYTYKKLTDVELIDSAIEPNLLIEEDGDIKKISASNIAVPQVQADWEEEDDTSPAFILNKPDLSEAGGGAKVVTYTIESSTLMLDGSAVSAEEVIDEWNSGSILRIGTVNTDFSGSSGNIVGVSFTTDSGSSYTKIIYFAGSDTTPTTFTIN